MVVNASRYANIDLGESVANSAQVVLKGASQFIGGVTNELLNPDNGGVEMGGLAITLAILAAVIGAVLVVKQKGTALIR